MDLRDPSLAGGPAGLGLDDQPAPQEQLVRYPGLAGEALLQLQLLFPALFYYSCPS